MVKLIISIILLFFVPPSFAQDVYTAITNDDEVLEVNEVEIQRAISQPSQDTVLTIPEVDKQLNRWIRKRDLADIKIAEWEAVREIMLIEVGKIKLKGTSEEPKEMNPIE